MEEGTPPILAELQGLTLGQLLEKAELVGIDEEALDGAESKPEVIALIVAKVEEQAAAEEPATRRTRLEEELDSMTLRALHRKALQLGADKQTLDEAEDKAAVIALIVELPFANVRGSAADPEKPQPEPEDHAEPEPETPPATQTEAEPTGHELSETRSAGAMAKTKSARESPVWVPGKEQCMLCDTPFHKLSQPKHHCRRCGFAVCGGCSEHERVLDTWLEPKKPHTRRETESIERLRVCLGCHTHYETVGAWNRQFNGRSNRQLNGRSRPLSHMEQPTEVALVTVAAEPEPETPPATQTEAEPTGHELSETRSAGAMAKTKSARESPVWVPGKEQCMLCDTPFHKLSQPKHHCRRCGFAVCGGCSEHERVLDTWLEPKKPHTRRETESIERLRVCLGCHTHYETVGAWNRQLSGRSRLTGIAPGLHAEWEAEPRSQQLGGETVQSTNATTPVDAEMFSSDSAGSSAHSSISAPRTADELFALYKQLPEAERARFGFLVGSTKNE